MDLNSTKSNSHQIKLQKSNSGVIQRRHWDAQFPAQSSGCLKEVHDCLHSLKRAPLYKLDLLNVILCTSFAFKRLYFVTELLELPLSVIAMQLLKSHVGQLTTLVTFFFFPHSKPTQDPNSGWRDGGRQRPDQSQNLTRDRCEPWLPY